MNQLHLIFGVGAEFLGGYADKGDVAVDFFLDFRHGQGNSRAVHAGHLGVVAAGMGRARLAPGIRVGGQGQRVHLAHQADIQTPRGFRIFQVSLYAGEADACPGLQAQLLQALRQLLGGTELLEAGFRVVPDVVAEADDLLGVFVDDLADSFFDLIQHERVLL